MRILLSLAAFLLLSVPASASSVHQADYTPVDTLHTGPELVFYASSFTITVADDVSDSAGYTVCHDMWGGWSCRDVCGTYVYSGGVFGGTRVEVYVNAVTVSSGLGTCFATTGTVTAAT